MPLNTNNHARAKEVAGDDEAALLPLQVCGGLDDAPIKREVTAFGDAFTRARRDVADSAVEAFGEARPIEWLQAGVGAGCEMLVMFFCSECCKQ